MLGRICSRAFVVILSLPLLLLPISCSEDSSPSDPGPIGSGAADFQAAIDAAGNYVNPVDSEVEGTPTAPADESRPDGTLWVCTEREIDIVTAPEELFLFSESGIVYPGALFQGKTLDRNPPVPINLPRGPGRIAIDLTTGEGETTFQDVPELTAEVVENAINQLVANRTFTPARFVVRTENIRSEEELQVKMRLSGNGYGFSGAASFRFRSDREYTRRLVTIEQVFFKARVARKTNPAEWFASSVTAADLNAFAGPGNPPVYVREMTYGRLVYILVEAEAEQTEIDAKVDATYNGLAGGATVVAEEEYVGRLEGVQLQAVVYGGDTESAALASAFSAQTAAEFNAAIALMVSSKQVPGGGLPLSYNMHDLKNDMTVKTKLATNYTLRDCTPVLTALADPVARWETHIPGSVISPVSTFDVNRTEFEILSVVDEGAGDPWYNGNPCSGHTGCVGGVACPSWTPDWQTGMIRMSGGSQVNRQATNEGLVSEISDALDPTSGPKLFRENDDSAPTLIEYPDRVAVGNVVQFHDWPYSSYTGGTQLEWDYPSEYYASKLRFDGSILEDTEYTLFIALQLPQSLYFKLRGSNCDGLNEVASVINTNAYNSGGIHVVYGTTDSFKLILTPAANGRHTIYATHGGNVWASADITGVLTDSSWHVYAVRFSPRFGMRIYIDGVPFAQNSAITTPIARGAFQGASIGSRSNPQVSVVRFRFASIYHEAGSDEAIKTESLEIRRQLGL